MIARVQTISRRVNPSSVFEPLVIVCRGNIGGRSGATLLAIRSVRHDCEFAALGRRPIDVGLAPRIVRYTAALEIRTVPSLHRARTLYQRVETFGGRGVPPRVEVQQIECARKAPHLNLRRLDLRLT